MALLAQGDSLTTRFIRRFDTLDPVAIAITAMANTQGGTIILGIDNVNFQLTGSTLRPDFLDWLSTAISPKVGVTVSEIQRHPHMLHVISVVMGTDKPYVFNGKTYRLDDRNPSAFKPIEEEAPIRPSLPSISPPFASHPLLEVSLSQTEGEGMVASSVSDYPQQVDSGPLSSFNSLLDRGQGIGILPLQSPPLSLNTSFSKALDDMAAPPVQGTAVVANTPVGSVHAPLNDRQRQALAFIGSAQTIQNKKYRALYSVSHKTAHLELTDMVNKGLIVPRGSGRSTHYVLQGFDV